MKRLKSLLVLCLLLFVSSVYSQTTKEEVLSDIRLASGVYQPYIYKNSHMTKAPDGYKPFYISHYGRHGSRWLDSPESYTTPQNILNEANKAGMLTEFGKKLCEKINIVAEDADGRYGDVSPQGMKEHKGIAERMFKNFPEIFSTENGRECFVFSRSTTVPRCILSMAANNERLKELNPKIKIERDAAKRFSYLNNAYKNADRDSINKVSKQFLIDHFDVQKFVHSIFTDTAYANKVIVDQPAFVSNLYYVVADAKDLDHLKISMEDIFTPDEFFNLWQASNIKLYLVFTSKVAKDSSKKLLRNILDCAESAIKNKNISADLRFGHDSYISPLLTLMNIEGTYAVENNPEKVYEKWCDFKVTPMAVNLQMVFYRNEKSDDILVKLLHNEKEVSIPIKTDIAPYYKWNDVKNYYEKIIAEK